LTGRSLWSAARGVAPLTEAPVFGEIYPGDASSLGHPERDIAYRWVREGEWKLIVPHRHGNEPPWGGYLSETALYNVSSDPAEMQNLASKQPERVQALQAKLDAWWKPTR
jgi:uncharacterized sulfatase